MIDINIKIQEDMTFSNKLLNMKLTDMYCKHMMKNSIMDGPKANNLFVESEKVGYKYCEWGSHSNHSSDLSYHLDIITKMESDNYNHAIRIVICKYKFQDEPIIWTDNLHSTIKYIREFGKEVELKDVPFYVVDLFDLKNPIIGTNNKNILKPNISDILGAISSAYFRYEMSNSQELINNKYTIDDFLNDNPELYTFRNRHIYCI